MKIDTRDIHGTKKIEISGNEPWLDQIYSYFKTPKKDFPRIVGTIELSYFEMLEAFKVRCQLQYTPEINCGRCGIKIPWPISIDSEIFFYPEHQAPSSIASDPQIIERDIRDLELYYVEDGAIDLESLINESIHLCVPTITVRPKSDDPDSCAICTKDLSDSQVYGTSKSEDPTNPFAALRALKNTKN